MQRHKPAHATKIKAWRKEVWERRDGDEKGGSDEASGSKKRLQKREREECENERRESNGCTIPCPLFYFLSSCVAKMALLNHKMLQRSPLTLPCVWHRSGRGSLTPIAALTVCCGVPVISACYCHPQSHVLKKQAHKRRQRENGIWNLEKNRVAQRDRWWKALRNLRGIEKGCTISFQRRFLFSAFDATEKSFTWWWKTELIHRVPFFMKHATPANNTTTKLTYKNTINRTFAFWRLLFSFIFKW